MNVLTLQEKVRAARGVRALGKLRTDCPVNPITGMSPCFGMEDGFHVDGTGHTFGCSLEQCFNYSPPWDDGEPDPNADPCTPGQIKDLECCGPGETIFEGECVSSDPCPDGQIKNPGCCGPGEIIDEGRCVKPTPGGGGGTQPAKPPPCPADFPNRGSDGECWQACGPHEKFNASDITCSCLPGFKRSGDFCIPSSSGGGGPSTKRIVPAVVAVQETGLSTGAQVVLGVTAAAAVLLLVKVMS